MDDAELKIVLRAAYERLERVALTNAVANPHTQEVILRSLKQLRTRLESDPAYAQELMEATRLSLKK